MQTVPLEFVAQLRPLMFVAGLRTPGDKASSSTDVKNANAASNGPAVNGEPPLAQSQNPARTPKADTDAFAELSETLATTLSTHRSSAIFEPGPVASGTADAENRVRFNVILVDKNIRFPPRKVRAQNASTATHSPISPFTPSSPLYPDGIMAPIWLRKHRELVPSVFILVLRLYEFAPGMVAADPTLRDDAQVGPLEKEKLERFRDNELVNDILNRKRTCSERGIKLAVVLLASRQMLDDSSLDTRLSHIRRMSTLDSRASLFVISPVPVNEVQQFVGSLLSELSDACLDYYREHGRRLRRKRSRPAHSVGVVGSQIMAADVSGGSNGQLQDDRLPLSIQALNVRYEFKSAAFAEFRNEQQVALKAYEDCYMALVELFIAAYSDKPSAVASNGAVPVTGATQLRARTKRWAEARMLADCISIKICKLYLYAQNQTYAMSQYNTHLRQFQRFSQLYWGMGQDSFEYWSWASKQHRMFADLVELAAASGHGPIAATTSLARSASRQLQYGPALVMQHPGFYFFVAGLCSIRRRDAFQAASSMLTQQNGSQEEPAALRHERNVPHAEQIIELFTKAYEHFKKAASTRLTLDIANRISAVYSTSGNNAAVLRFDDRIQDAYRKHRWKNILSTILLRSDTALENILSQSHSTGENAAPASQASASADRIVKNCLERMALRRTRPGIVDATKEWQRLLPILARFPNEKQNIVAIRDIENSLPLDCNCVFWQAQADLLSASGKQAMVPFQLHVRAAPFRNLPVEIAISSVTATFEGMEDTLVIRHADASSQTALIVRHDLSRGLDDQLADLRSTWPLFCFEGVIGSMVATAVSLKEVTVRISIADHQFDLHCQPHGRRVATRWQTLDSSKLKLTHLPMHDLADHSRCRFEPRKLDVTFEVPESSHAYLDEHYAITCNIVNKDSMAVKVTLDALLHPLAQGPSGGGDSDRIELDGHEQQRSSISGAVCIEKLEPGSTHAFKLYVTGRSIPAIRHLDLSIMLQPADVKIAEIAVTEVSHHVTVDITHPLFCDYRTAWQRCSALSRRLYETSKVQYELDIDQQSQAKPISCSLEVTVGALGPSDLRLRSITLETTAASANVKTLSSSIVPHDGQLPADLQPEEAFLAIFQLQLPYTFDFDEADLQSMLLVVEWERSASDPSDSSPSSATKTSIPVSPFSRPLGFCNAKDQLQPFIAFDAPASAVLHESFDVSFYWVRPAALFSQDDAQPGLARPMRISWQVESGTEDFVFSGPRKVEQRLIVPMMERHGDEVVKKLASYTFLPVGKTGLLRLPRFTAYQFVNSPAAEQRIRQDCEERGEAYPGPLQLSLPMYAGHSTLYGPSAGEEATAVGAAMLPSEAVSVYVLPGQS